MQLDRCEVPTEARQRGDRQAALRRLRRAQIKEAKRIRRIVAWAYGYTPAHLRAKDRPAPLAEARQVAMYLMRTGLHWPTATGNRAFPAQQIGAILRRDHATVLHGVAGIAARRAVDAPLRRLLDDLCARLDREYEGEPTADHVAA